MRHFSIVGCGGLVTLIRLRFLAYYVAFGPHGPRTPVSPPGSNFKVLIGTGVAVGVAGLMFLGFRAMGSSLAKQLPDLLVSQQLIIYSPATTKIHVEGMAGSIKRACEGAEDEPNFW